MSIKSQRSLNNECSEIFEKSYSVGYSGRSVSEESLPDYEEQDGLVRDLLYKLSPSVLTRLRRAFKRRTHKDHLTDIDRKVEEVMRVAAAEEGIEFAETAAPSNEKKLWIDEDTFVTTLNTIFDNHKYEPHARQLFSLLDPFCTRKVWWRDLVDRMVDDGARRHRSRLDTWTRLSEDGLVMKQLQHCKRETIVKLVSIERGRTFCYVILSRGGRVGVYGGELQLLRQYDVFQHRTGVQRRVNNCWLTDALYMPDVQCLVISCSDRSLTFYNAATLDHAPVFCITGMPNIPTCMSYEPTTRETDTSRLLLGDERGDVTLVTFLRPAASLLHKRHADIINYYFWRELWSPPHTAYCNLHRWRHVHGRSVRRVATCPGRGVVLSCSHDPHASLVFRHTGGKLHDYVFKFPRGVTCFHYAGGVVAAGDAGGAVRVLQGGVAGGVLQPPGAPAPVRDVALLLHLHIVLAYTKDMTIHIWDLYEECILQSVKLKFPFLGVLGRKVEFGTHSIHPGPARETTDIDAEEEEEEEKEREYWSPRDYGKDIECLRWRRDEVVVSGGDCVCVVPMIAPSTPGTQSAPGTLPPPAPQLAARRPSIWERGRHIFCRESLGSPTREETKESREEVKVVITAEETFSLPPLLLEKIDIKRNECDVDELLEKADLKDILQKDFVKMMGLKSDLNQKLAATQAHFDAMQGPVRAGAPYLALTLHQPGEVNLMEDLEANYRRVLRLFPSSRSVSCSSSPRSRSTSARRSKR